MLILSITVLPKFAANAAIDSANFQRHALRSSVSGSMQLKTWPLFCSLFSSPLKRARTTSEIMWRGRDGPVSYIESLREAPLGWLQGMTNGKKCCLTLCVCVLWTAWQVYL